MHVINIHGFGGKFQYHGVMPAPPMPYPELPEPTPRSYLGERMHDDSIAGSVLTSEFDKCRWSQEGRQTPMEASDIQNLLEKTGPLVRRDLPNGGEGWMVHYAAFSRAGFTAGATSEMQKRQGLLIDLEQLDDALGRG